MKGAFFVFQLNMGLLHATVDANIIRSLKAIDGEKNPKKSPYIETVERFEFTYAVQ